MENRFDTIAKALASDMPRRQVFKLLGTGIVGSALASILPASATAESPTLSMNGRHPIQINGTRLNGSLVNDVRLNGAIMRINRFSIYLPDVQNDDSNQVTIG